MLCDDVKRLAYFFLDGSLGESRRTDLDRHIGACPDCGTRIEIHRRLRRFVRTRLEPVSAPEAFRVRLSQSLRTFGAR